MTLLCHISFILDHTWTDLTAAHSHLVNTRLYISCFLLFIFDIWSESMILGAAETIYYDGPAICAAHKAHLCAYSPHHLNSSTWKVPEGLLTYCFVLCWGSNDHTGQRAAAAVCWWQILCISVSNTRCIYILFYQNNPQERVGAQFCKYLIRICLHKNN